MLLFGTDDDQSKDLIGTDDDQSKDLIYADDDQSKDLIYAITPIRTLVDDDGHELMAARCGSCAMQIPCGLVEGSSNARVVSGVLVAEDPTAGVVPP